MKNGRAFSQGCMRRIKKNTTLQESHRTSRKLWWKKKCYLFWLKYVIFMCLVQHQFSFKKQRWEATTLDTEMERMVSQEVLLCNSWLQIRLFISSILLFASPHSCKHSQLWEEWHFTPPGLQSSLAGNKKWNRGIFHLHRADQSLRETEPTTLHRV